LLVMHESNMTSLSHIIEDKKNEDFLYVASYK